MKMQHFCPPCSRMLLLQLLLSFLVTPLKAQTINPSYSYNHHLFHFCNGTNFTVSSPFQRNLQSFITKITMGADFTDGFYNATIGDQPDVVYAILQCSGTFSGQACGVCASSGIKYLQESCGNTRTAAVYITECVLHYSDNNFLGAFDANIGYITGYSAVDPKTYNKALLPFISGLIISATSKSKTPRKMSSANRTPFGGTQNISAVVQCTGDLSTSSCSECLQTIFSIISAWVETTVVGADLYSKSFSCFIRFEVYAFFPDSGLTKADDDVNSAANVPAQQPVKAPVAVSPPQSPAINVTFGNPIAPKPKSSGIIIPVVVSLIGLAMLAAAALILRVNWRRRQTKARKAMSENDVQEMALSSEAIEAALGVDYELQFFSLSTVLDATSDFSNSNKLGEGGYGPVYKGQLIGGRQIAVKRLAKGSGQGMDEFKTEVKLIAKLQHRNLVKLLGCCIQNEERLLIYEYMQNGSLDKFIFDDEGRGELQWKSRFNIIEGVARGILYLHQDSRLRVIHRDLKASNVLLDTDMNPKISDFGLARIVGGGDNEANTNRIAGTYGYMAPEYALQGHFSIKSDVYSFGVLILEIISGRRNGCSEEKVAEILIGYGSMDTMVRRKMLRIG